MNARGMPLLREASEMMFEVVIATVFTVAMVQLHWRKGCAIP